ncbi:MAG: hypothetical protein ACRYHA_27920 [Janthinobacterium lividum]
MTQASKDAAEKALAHSRCSGLTVAMGIQCGKNRESRPLTANKPTIWTLFTASCLNECRANLTEAFQSVPDGWSLSRGVAR